MTPPCSSDEDFVKSAERALAAQSRLQCGVIAHQYAAPGFLTRRDPFRAGRTEDHLSLRRIAIPGVQVVREHGLYARFLGVRQRGIARQQTALDLGQLFELGQQGGRVRIEDIRQQLRGKRHAAEQYLLTQHLPCGQRCAHLLLEPVPLLHAEHGSVGVSNCGLKRRDVEAGLGQEVEVIELLIPSDNAGETAGWEAIRSRPEERRTCVP